MPEEPPNESSSMPGDEESSPPQRPKSLTPEQRRFLGGGRSLRREEAERSSSEKESAPAAGESSRPQPAPSADIPERSSVSSGEVRQPRPAESAARPEAEPRRPAAPASAMTTDQSSSRSHELQTAALIIGALLLVALTFYIGKKFDYWRYRLFSNNQPKLEAGADKFPGVSPDELITQALGAEHAGKWQDAGERYMAAKHKDLRYRGLLFRVGKIAYDHNDLSTADKLFERAIAFGENLDAANCYRGLIATRRRDFPAAELFFKAAVTSEPFVPFYPFYLGDVLRLDHHSKEAIPNYQRAEQLAVTPQDAAVFRFKALAARLESGDTAGVTADLNKLSSSGPLPLEWLMTEAALKVRAGEPDEAVQILTDAKMDPRHLIFVSCMRDQLFEDAKKKYPELAQFDQANEKALTPGP